jgi:hypothetical protein
MKHLFVAFFFCAAIPCFAWDYEGHRIVNQAALAALPKDFPAFVRTADAVERIAFLGGEPDRWRNTPDLPLKHWNGPDHFIDLEDLEPLGLNVASLTHFRHEYTAQVALARAAHPDRFPSIDPTKNADHTRELPGFLPWTITEDYAQLKSAFSYLKAFEEAGTSEEIANARQNVIYFMGVMGHFVGDASQPLHTTRHFNGWVGKNARGYTTNKSFHSWIDGGFALKTAITLKDLKVKPARPIWPAHSGKHDDVFPEVMAYIREQFTQLEPLYELEKAGKLSVENESSKEGREFIVGQLLRGSEMLASLWLTAWQEAPPDTYLKARLAERKARAAAPQP